MNEKKLEKYKDSFKKNKKRTKEQKDANNNMQTALRLYSLDRFSWSEYYSEVLNCQVSQRCTIPFKAMA